MSGTPEIVVVSAELAKAREYGMAADVRIRELIRNGSKLEQRARDAESKVRGLQIAVDELTTALGRLQSELERLREAKSDTIPAPPPKTCCACMTYEGKGGDSGWCGEFGRSVHAAAAACNTFRDPNAARMPHSIVYAHAAAADGSVSAPVPCVLPFVVVGPPSQERAQELLGEPATAWMVTSGEQKPAPDDPRWKPMTPPEPAGLTREGYREIGSALMEKFPVPEFAKVSICMACGIAVPDGASCGCSVDRKQNVGGRLVPVCPPQEPEEGTEPSRDEEVGP